MGKNGCWRQDEERKLQWGWLEVEEGEEGVTESRKDDMAQWGPPPNKVNLAVFLPLREMYPSLAGSMQLERHQETTRR